MKIKNGWKRFKKNNKGVAIVWAYIMVSMVVLGLVYTVITPIWDDYLTPLANETFNLSNESMQTYTYIRTSWRAFPMIMIIGLFIYGIVQGQKTEYDTGFV